MKIAATSLLMALLLNLAACGGGGGGDGDTPPPTTELPQLTINQGDLCIGGYSLGGGISTSLTISNLQFGEAGLTGLDLSGSGNIQISGLRARQAPAARDGVTVSETPVPVTGCGATPDTAPEELGWVPGVLDWTGELTIISHGRSFTFDEVDPEPAADDPVTPLTAARIDGILMLDGPGVDGLILMRLPDCPDQGDCNTWHLNPRHEPSWYGLDEIFSHSNEHLDSHYHGLSDELFEAHAGTLRQVGMAADGYPIASGWFDDSGMMRRATSSYQLKTGDRVSGFLSLAPPGPHNGEYVEDYEYVEGSGDLDECNGMVVNGVYTYFMTPDFPYLMNCLRGTPDDSFLINPS